MSAAAIYVYGKRTPTSTEPWGFLLCEPKGAEAWAKEVQRSWGEPLVQALTGLQHADPCRFAIPDSEGWLALWFDRVKRDWHCRATVFLHAALFIAEESITEEGIASAFQLIDRALEAATGDGLPVRLTPLGSSHQAGVPRPRRTTCSCAGPGKWKDLLSAGAVGFGLPASACDSMAASGISVLTNSDYSWTVGPGAGGEQAAEGCRSETSDMEAVPALAGHKFSSSAVPDGAPAVAAGMLESSTAESPKNRETPSKSTPNEVSVASTESVPDGGDNAGFGQADLSARGADPGPPGSLHKSSMAQAEEVFSSVKDPPLPMPPQAPAEIAAPAIASQRRVLRRILAQWRLIDWALPILAVAIFLLTGALTFQRRRVNELQSSIARLQAMNSKLQSQVSSLQTLNKSQISSLKKEIRRLQEQIYEPSQGN